MSFFSCRNLSKSFDGNPVLEQVNIDFPSHGLISIMGASGSGKSTLIHCLLGLEKCEGDVYFRNKKSGISPISGIGIPESSFRISTFSTI